MMCYIQYPRTDLYIMCSYNIGPNIYAARNVASLQEPDAADMCLLGERTHLLSIKRSLEAELSKVQQQLQVLSVARARLAAIVQERSRVTDLLCHSMSMTVAVSHFASSSQIFNKVSTIICIIP